MVNQSVIETAKNFIDQIPKNLVVSKSYLFGSYARGNEHEDSDIDIAVIIDNMTDFYETQMELMRIRRKIDLRIEPHPFKTDEFSSSNPFANEIKNTGIEIS
ncbi:MAG: nucleotidyltransferase domain-containing protein [Paludibacter sp.]|nr:nucleotidyltransferase domain-containing protein [Paludibacter sp.]